MKRGLTSPVIQEKGDENQSNDGAETHSSGTTIDYVSPDSSSDTSGKVLSSF